MKQLHVLLLSSDKIIYYYYSLYNIFLIIKLFLLLICENENSPLREVLLFLIMKTIWGTLIVISLSTINPLTV